MINNLRVKNFKSLRDVEIELGKFTVLLGPNASGKSNVLDSLMVLSDISREGLVNAFNTRGGLERLIFAGKGEKLELAIEFSRGGIPGSYLLCVNSGSRVEREILVMGNDIALDRVESECKVLRSDKEVIKTTLSANETALPLYRDNVYYPLVSVARAYLDSWRLYQIVTSEVRRVIGARKSFDLEKSGANLAQVLISLHNEFPKLFLKVQDILRQGIPEVEELLTPLTTDGNTYVALRETSFERPFDHFQLSDGTIKLLAYITAMTLPETSLICFEEPENFMHSRLLQLLVDVLKKSEKQVILSTHSPYLVDFIEPEDIRLVRKVNGETRVSRVDNLEGLKESMKEMGLGELWYSGEFGGTS